MRGPLMIQGQVFLELERWPDAKLVYVDPAHVVAIEPGEDGETYIRLYADGGSITVLGDPPEISQMICEARGMINSLTLGAIVGLVKDELKPKAEVVN